MSEHSRYLSPSSAGQWVNCHAAPQMQQQHPKEDDGSQAADGILCHDLSAKVLKANASTVRQYITLNPQMEGLTDDIIAGAEDYVESVRSGRGCQHVDYHVEERVDVSVVHPMCFGTVDCWYVLNRVLHVNDLKFGWGIVEVIRNWQLLLYAIGLVFGKLVGQVDSVVLHIVQPRPNHPDGTHRRWTVTVADLMNYLQTAKAAAEAVYAPNPDCTTGPWCKHCSAFLHCNAAQKAWPFVLELVESMSSTGVSVDQIAFRLHLLRRGFEMIKHQLTATEATALSLHRKGHSIPGWQEEAAGGKLEWIGDPSEVRAMAELMGIKVDKKPDLITPTQAIKAGLPEDVVAMYTVRKSGASKMVPINPYKTTVQTMFEEI